jgi:hypothetical protein
MEKFAKEGEIAAGIRPIPENNLNKIALDEKEAEKQKRRRGAILGALLQMGITTASLEAMGAPTTDPENVAEQIIKADEEAKSEQFSQDFEKSQRGVLQADEFDGAGAEFIPGANIISVTAPKDLSEHQKEALKQQFDKAVSEMIKQNHSETGKLSVPAFTLMPTEEMRTPLAQKIVERYEQESGKIVEEGPDGTMIVTPPKNFTTEQKEALKHQMDEWAQKMIEQNHQ